MVRRWWESQDGLRGEEFGQNESVDDDEKGVREKGKERRGEKGGSERGERHVDCGR